MNKSRKVIRIPQDLIPLWESIRSDLSREVKASDELGSDGRIKDAIAVQKVLLEYSKRDYYLMKDSIMELKGAIKSLETKFETFSSQLLTLSIQLNRTGGY